jgi:hypothetical protein
MEEGKKKKEEGRRKKEEGRQFLAAAEWRKCPRPKFGRDPV